MMHITSATMSPMGCSMGHIRLKFNPRREKWRGRKYRRNCTFQYFDPTTRRRARCAPWSASSRPRRLSFSEVAFINYVGFLPCCSRLLVTLLTTTPLLYASFLPEEAFTDRHSQVLSGERDPRLQAVTTRETADEGSLGTRLLNATSEEIEAYFCK